MEPIRVAGLVLSGKHVNRTTSYGGSLRNGVVFRLLLPPVIAPATSVDGSFHLAFSGFPGTLYTIEVSTNLVNWTVLTNFVSITETIEVTDSRESPQRFYRALQPP